MRIGVDLGGTKIEAVVLDASGEIVLRKREATKRGVYRNIVNQIVLLVRSLESEVKANCSVGIGIPGSVSLTTGLVRNANTAELNGQSFKKDLELELSRSIAVENDANCFVLSEATDGSAKGFASVFGIILGTGTGAGIFCNGHLLQGTNGIAGEWGHNPLPWMTEDEYPGRDCFCGRKGCIETFLSGPGLEIEHFLLTAEKITAKEISARALSNDDLSIQVLNSYMDRLARSLAHVCNLIDPSVIVLGGGLSGIEQLYEQVPRMIERYTFSDHFKVDLLPPKHGDSSGVRGAAWLSGRH